MKRKHCLNRDGGSFTIEAAIILPIILLIIMSIIYVGILLYQQIYLQSLANRAVQQGVFIWGNPKKDIYTGRITKYELKEGGLYRMLFDPYREDKLQAVEDFINHHIDRYSILDGRNRMVYVSTEKDGLYSMLVVSIHCTYSIPIGRWLGLFGADGSYAVFVRSQAYIYDPLEFIRNTDFLTTLFTEFQQKYDGKIVDISDVLSKVKSFITIFQGR